TPIEVISGLSSAEALYEALAAAPRKPGLIFEDELRTLFVAGSRKGTRNLLPSLCRLYNAPKRDQISRARHGNLTLEEPFISLLGATTTTWIQSGLEEEAVAGGFFNRNLIIAGERKTWIAHPAPPPPERFDAFTATYLRPLVESLSDGRARP